MGRRKRRGACCLCRRAAAQSEGASRCPATLSARYRYGFGQRATSTDLAEKERGASSTLSIRCGKRTGRKKEGGREGGRKEGRREAVPGTLSTRYRYGLGQRERGRSERG
eukprot:588298-Rhodomonas_salina.1